MRLKSKLENTPLPKVIIVVISHNQINYSLNCLFSISKLNYYNYDILFIDNGSRDGTYEVIKSNFPEINLIQLKNNIGAAGGRNLGINFALNRDFDYIFFLDNDAIVEPDTLTELIRVASGNLEIVGVGAITYYFGNPSKIWNFGGRIDWLRGFFIDTHQNKLNECVFDNFNMVDSFPIGFGIIKCEIIKKIGNIDEKYFIYFEEADWHIRIKRLGYKLAVTPKARIWHKVSSSLGKETSGFYYYRTRNRLLFMIKNAPWFLLPVFFFYFIYDFSYNTLLTLHLSKKYEQLRAAMIGVLDFLSGRFGKRFLSDELLRRPLYKTLIKIAGERFKRCSMSLYREIKFFLKRALKIKLKILVSLDWNLGDEIMAIPVYKAVRDKFPNSIINAKVRYPEILYNNPYINQINTKMINYDRIFDLKEENKTENRITYLEKKLKFKINDRIPKVHIRENEIVRDYILEAVHSNKKKVALSAGANWNSRQWGIEKFKKIAKYLIDKYDLLLIELGRDCESIGLGLNLINKTSIREAAIILKRCNLFIGNDSGLLHLALAVGTPVIGLYGPLNPCKLVENKNIFYPVWSRINCRGCWSNGYMLHPDVCPKGNPECLSQIDAEDVIRTLDENILKK